MKKETFVYKKLPTAIKLPEELQHDIDRYIDYLEAVAYPKIAIRWKS